MNKKTLFSAAAAPVLLIYAVREGHERNVAQDPNIHYRLGNAHDVAVGKSSKRVDKVVPNEESPISLITGDERPVLTADSFRDLPNDFTQLKDDFSKLQAEFEEHNNHGKVFVSRNYSAASLEQIEKLVDYYITESTGVADRKMPHLQHLMNTQRTYKQHFELFAKMLVAMKDMIAILRDDPVDVIRDTGLSPSEIQKILEAIDSPKFVREQTTSYAPGLN